MISAIGRLYQIKPGSTGSKNTTVSFSAARYMTALSAAEKRGSVFALKRNLAREAQKIKNSGGDSAQVKRALQKIKYVMRKADEKISHLGNEERKNAELKRAEDAGKKEEAKRLKKNVRVQKYFRKSNEHGNIVRTALEEKEEMKSSGFSGGSPEAGVPFAAEVTTGVELPAAGAAGNSIDILA